MLRRSFLALVRSTTLVAFGGGIAYAAWDAVTIKWVREFQAGAGSPWGERLLSLATRGTLEGLGFALVAVLLAALAGALTTFTRGDGAPGKRHLAWYLLALCAFLAWSTFGAWLGNEALPFLDPLPLLALDVVGFAACLLVLGVVGLLEGLLPGRRPASPLPRAVGTIAGTLAGATAGLLWLQSAEAGWRAPSSLALALALGLGSVPLARLVGRLVERPLGALEARAERGRLVPRALQAVLALGLVACAACALPGFRLSATLADVDYADLEPVQASPGRPNVVLVTIDTLRADHLGAYGYRRPTSPFIDSLAAEGTLFADASAAAAWTKPATGTILTGLFPSRHGALYHGSSLQLPEGERTLAEAFRDGGWVTAGFVTNPNVKRIFAFDRGFQEYYDSPVEDTVALASIRSSLFGRLLMNLTRHQFNWKYENDIFQMNRHVSAWLEKNTDDPFFLYLHYIDPHIPYSPPAEYRELFARDPGLALFNDRKERVGMDLYDGEIRFSDDGIEELVSRLKELGLWDNTVFFLTSDHGEEFFEHGVLGHGFSLYQAVVHVPLIAHGPGVAVGRRVETPVQIVDLAATLTDLSGLGDTLGDGHSFAAALEPTRVLVDDGSWHRDTLYFLENEFGQSNDPEESRDFVLNGVREGHWKLVLTERNAYFPPEIYGGQALYDLDRDPGEQENLILSKEHREIVQRLLERLREHSKFLAETGFRDVEPAALSAEMAENLRALGYL